MGIMQGYCLLKRVVHIATTGSKWLIHFRIMLIIKQNKAMTQISTRDAMGNCRLRINYTEIGQSLQIK